jgi:ADP-heptose:LPS heptosyltransferase
MIFAVRNKQKDKQKRLCIVRYGAWGDAIMLSPVLPYFKKDGWHITLNCTEKTYEILKTDPNIDSYLIQESNEVKIEDLKEHWKKLEQHFDKLLNFTGSIEKALLVAPNQKEYYWTKEQLHERCNKNYYDETLKWAGYPEAKGEQGRLYFTKSEERWAKKFFKKHRGFTIVWCLTGSSIHKIYPFAGNVIDAVSRGLPQAKIVLVGEGGAKGIITPHKRIIDKCGDFGIRESFILTKYADLVVSTETSVLVSAGCFNTPKIAMLSHGSEENVTKYYKRCIVVRESVKCSPCHKLHYSRETCPLVKEFNHPVCMGLLHPKKLLAPIEEIYKKWRIKDEYPHSTN